jgi:hypothetical protein
LADRERDPRDRERELHRAQLEAVRSAYSAQEPPPGGPGGGQPPGPDDPDDGNRADYLLARLRADLRKLDRRQRNTARVAVALGIAVAVGAVALVQQAMVAFDRTQRFGEIRALSIRADRIAVTRDLRVVDAAGNELAVLGRDFGEAGSVSAETPVVLELNAQGEPGKERGLRLAASNAGAGLTLGAPTGKSSVSLLTTHSGSSVEVRNGERTERLSGEPPTAPLPAVAAAPPMRAARVVDAREVPLVTPKRDGPRSGALAELRDVGHGFLVADLAAEPAGEGVELRGRMVNTTAVVHSGVAFRVTLGEGSAVLTVPKISPGNSTGFRVALPGAPADTLDGARIEYLGSTVAFQASSTEPVHGRQVESGAR